MPPFARLKPPTSTIKEEIELVWDDSVAPETCIDFDAHESMPTSAVFASVFLAMSLLTGLYFLISFSDPVGSNPVATRREVLSHPELRRQLGLTGSLNGDAEEE